MTKRILAAAFAAFALTLSACGGDSKTPLGPTIELTEEQSDDMMDALSVIGLFDGGTFGFSTSAASMVAALKNPTIALATVSVDEQYDCPAGGSYRQQGNFTGNDAGTSFSMNLSQTYTSCAGESSTGTVWTFNSAPSITTTLTANMNQSTGAFTITGTNNGAFNVSSSVGSGSCVINLSLSITGNDNSETFSGSVTGSVCGRSVSQTLDVF